jgi:hypothetical protein
LRFRVICTWSLDPPAQILLLGWLYLLTKYHSDWHSASRTSLDCFWSLNFIIFCTCRSGCWVPSLCFSSAPRNYRLTSNTPAQAVDFWEAHVQSCHFSSSSSWHRWISSAGFRLISSWGPSLCTIILTSALLRLSSLSSNYLISLTFFIFCLPIFLNLNRTWNLWFCWSTLRLLPI